MTAVRENFLSVDPGFRHCGCALWENGRLVSAMLIEGESTDSDVAVVATATGDAVVRRSLQDVGWKLFSVAIELPRTYGGRAKRGDANDLIRVAAVVGAIAAAFGPSRTKSYLPEEWKGQVPKPTKRGQPYPIEQRCRMILTPGEIARVQVPKNWRRATDVWDAVGIGLHYLGRRVGW